MDLWAPNVRHATEGVGYLVNDTGTIAVSTTGRYQASATGSSVVVHSTPGDRWVDSYVELVGMTVLTTSRVGASLRFVDVNNSYRAYVTSTAYAIAKTVAGTASTVVTGAATPGTGPWSLRFEAEADNLRLYLRGVLIASAKDTSVAGAGFAGLHLQAATNVANAEATRFEAGPLRFTYTAGVETNTAISRRAATRLR